MSVHYEWRDRFGDKGIVATNGGGFADMRMYEGGIVALHSLTPDSARAVAEALNQAAFDIDGKGSTVAELTAQLEQARSMVERYALAMDSLSVKWKVIAECESSDCSCDDCNPYNAVVRDLESVMKRINAPQCMPCVCGNGDLASETIVDIKSTIRCPKCGRIADASTMNEATERWNAGRKG